MRPYCNGASEVKKKTVKTSVTAKTKAEQWANPYSHDKISPDDPVVQALFEGIKEGNRSTLARSITLVENILPKKKAQAQLLLAKVLEHNRKVVKHSLKKNRAFRIGE